MKFLDIFAGWPGSVHDARVYRNSPVNEYFSNGHLADNLHIVGDSAYPLSMNMMVPYRDNGHLTDIQKKYNKHHSTSRIAIERAFGLLKNKFRRLKYLDVRSLNSIPLIISATCVLHNFILINEKDLQFVINIEILKMKFLVRRRYCRKATGHN